ncbi:unnamed protein product [Rotaria sordida]|uniref:Uncharacterized protein n=1 Tax=Rotaria sordida TaxID=392033 RepID=A0A815CQT0_9BILA|nr:unnamed protein product [Rotaria sordida]CAF1290548.1 unnamed protein product [Rotaria sordida]
MHYRHTNSSYYLNDAPTSSLLKDNNDFIWNNSNELDLIQMKKSSLMTTTTYNQRSFFQVLPCIRRLHTIFDSICPNIYRIHCSDSLRILNEIICLTDEYFHIIPSTKIKINELLFNEYYFDDFISKLRRPSLIRQKNSYSSIKSELYCFGQGIHTNNFNNQLNQTILFCFELTINNLSLPIDIRILDPNEKLVSNDIKYINTYNQGHTKLFSCSYKPIIKAGIYNISFYINNIKVPHLQYTVFIYDTTSNNNSYQKEEQLLIFENIIEKPQHDIPQYELEGDGCSTKIIVNSIARFRLRIKSSVTSYYNNPIVDLFSLTILDPYGHTIVVQRRIISIDLIELTYQPMSIGEHQLIILFNNKIHRQLTIDVINDELNYLSKLKPFGPGLKHAIVGLPTEFYVDLNQTINHDIHFRLEPSYHAEIDYEQQLATVRYIPFEDGNCPIHILENDKDILHSPFIAQIEKNITYHEKPRIRVIGLSKQIVLHRPVEFQVFVDNPFDDSNNLLHIDILTDDEQSPSVSIRRRHRSSYLCSFIPVTLGKHLISIDYASIVAENNPFYCQSIQDKDILLTGPAINNQCLTLNQPTHFCFTLKDFLTKNFNDKNSTYESGYSSNDDISSKSSLSSSSSTDIQTSTHDDDDDNNNNNYHVRITDGHGTIKPNILVKEIFEKQNENIVRVDFTPDEQILYINISCTCSTTFEPHLTSTPKKVDTTLILPNLCSTPRPAHIRWSLSKYTPRPVDSSTPNTRKIKKSAIPNLHHLIYPFTITNKQTMKIWVL